jgi:hypothetical protein
MRWRMWIGDCAWMPAAMLRCVVMIACALVTGNAGRRTHESAVSAGVFAYPVLCWSGRSAWPRGTGQWGSPPAERPP